MATSQTRARPGKAAAPKAAKTAPSRNSKLPGGKAPARAGGKSATASKATGKAPAPKKASSKASAPSKVINKASAPKKAAVTAPRKVATSGKAVAKAGPVKSAARKAAVRAPKVLDAFAQLRKLVLDALDDLKARDVVEVDVRGKSSVADLLVVASGTSSRHVKSIADEVVVKAKRAGVPPIGVEGQRDAEWVLVDLGDVIVHVMLPRTREFYGLERLWSVGDWTSDELPVAG